MSVLPLSNSFEGGINGTEITAANSGGASGNAFDGKVPVGGTLVLYSNAQARGTLSMQIAQAGVWAAAYTNWTLSPALTAKTYCRLYLFLSGVPATQMPIICWIGGGLFSASLAITTAGKLRSLDFNPATLATSTVSCATGQWIKVEAEITPGTSGASLNARLYNDAGSDEADDTISSTGLALRANIDEIRVGQSDATGAGPISETHYWDGVAVQATAFGMSKVQSRSDVRGFGPF